MESGQRMGRIEGACGAVEATCVEALVFVTRLVQNL